MLERLDIVSPDLYSRGQEEKSKIEKDDDAPRPWKTRIKSANDGKEENGIP
jgi:hypothetical protein